MELPKSVLPSASSSLSSAPLTAVQQNFVTQLGISNSCLDQNNHALRYAFMKYQEYLHVHSIWKNKKSDATWAGGGKASDLKGIFASPSYFYSYYRLFEFIIAKYPDMVDWLENVDGNYDDQSSDEDIWGFAASGSDGYTITLLRKFLLDQGENVNAKGSKEVDVKVEVNKDKKGKNKGKEKMVLKSAETKGSKKKKDKGEKKAEKEGNSSKKAGTSKKKSKL